MADNVGYTPGSGAVIAADDIGGVLYQRVKIGVGADNTAVDVSDANPMPVALSGVSLDTPVPVHDEDNHLQLLRIINALSAPQGYDRSLQRQRGTVVVESGTVTTVTTVTNATNLANIGSEQGQLLIRGSNLSAWRDCVRSLIS